MLSTNCLWLIIIHLCSLHFVMRSAAICVGSSVAAGSWFATCQPAWRYHAIIVPSCIKKNGDSFNYM